ncbi:uncharacterized protein isoform X4 [Musca autumnalis]|uniref:uncharacterized protein isoform X4 n=1 Tax=Musca autumnalis TaxID=221902 RepID=UPI003CE8D386
MTTEMFISDIIYLTFLMVLLFIIIYKGFKFDGGVNLPEDQQFNITRDSLYFNRHCFTRSDRQANVFTIHDETSRESRYNDIFFIEPNSVEAARIRAQLEKDDKDLPSYEEVMRMTSINPTTTTSAVAGMTASNASVNTTETILSVPPYSEVDPMTSASSSGNATSTAGGTGSSATTTASTRTSQPPPMPAAMVSSSVDITQQSSSIV